MIDYIVNIELLCVFHHNGEYKLKFIHFEISQPIGKNRASLICIK